MFEEKNNNIGELKAPKLLIAPLDWGLGHATRCIPIINELLLAGYEVIIASDGNQAQLIRAEFPHLRFVELRGYGLRFGKNSPSTILRICLQVPKILTRIKHENRWLNIFLRSENIDAIISDNRYGLYSKEVLSIFITHQLHIKTPFGKWAEKRLQQLNYKYINRFSQCWIPDNEKSNPLAGELSHPQTKPIIPIKYIGCLSRFKKKNSSPVYKILILLSGPEPQRTLLEKKLIAELKSYKEKTILLRGLPTEKETIFISPSTEVYNHLNATALNEKISQSGLVICRSGYSSIMDLAKLNKKAILIPTPGQAEQQYLADYLFEKKYALKMDQHNFSLHQAMEAAKKFPFANFPEEENQLLSMEIQKLKLEIEERKSKVEP